MKAHEATATMDHSSYAPRLESLDLRPTPCSRLACSLVLNSVLVAGLLLIPVTVSRTFEPAPKVTEISLTAPPPPPPEVPRPKPHVIVHPPPPVPDPPPVKAVQKQFIIPPPPVRKPETHKVELPPVPVEAPKPVEVAKLEAPKIEARPPVAPHEVFAASNEAAPSKEPVKAIKTGGFGDPNGAQPNPNSTKPSELAAVGSFDLSKGSGHAAGSGSNGKTLVARAGFGDGLGAAPVAGAPHGGVQAGGFGDGPGGAPASTGGGQRGTVQAGGFNTYEAPAKPVSAVTRPAAPAQTPVEITYKPKPAYTPEAREKKIEGDVELEVLFSAAGQIQVIRLIRGLGYGLDENARQAASQIRFRPGTRNGVPVDMTGTVHITFQIS